MNRVVLEYPDKRGRLTHEYPSSITELLDRLECIRTEYGALCGMPFGVDLVRDGEGTLVVGLGDDEWLFMFHPVDENNEPTTYSLGNEYAEGSASFYLGDAGLMSRKYLIARSDALKVLKSWFETGELGDAVKWTDTIY